MANIVYFSVQHVAFIARADTSPGRCFCPEAFGYLARFHFVICGLFYFLSVY